MAPHIIFSRQLCVSNVFRTFALRPQYTHAASDSTTDVSHGAKFVSSGPLVRWTVDVPAAEFQTDISTLVTSTVYQLV